MQFIVIVGEDPETGTPVHGIAGTLQQFPDHASAAHAAQDLVRHGITTKGAFVCALRPTAFYLPVPVARQIQPGDNPDVSGVDESIVDADLIDDDEGDLPS